MSITDELREYALGWDERNRVRCDLTAIADRIDAEHEQQMAERRRGCVFYDAERNYCKVHDEGDMAELGYVRLPVDTDGVPIRIGDVMRLGSVERDLTVLGFGVPDASGNDYGVFVCEGDDYVWYNARFLRHHHAPTVEDVLQELVIDWDCAPDGEDKADVLKEYAAKLQLKEDE